MSTGLEALRVLVADDHERRAAGHDRDLHGLDDDARQQVGTGPDTRDDIPTVAEPAQRDKTPNES